MNIGKTKRAILMLIDNQPIHGYEIAKKLDLSLSTIYGHLKYLDENQYIDKQKTSSNGKKLLTLTKKGEALLSFLDEY